MRVLIKAIEEKNMTDIAAQVGEVATAASADQKTKLDQMKFRGWRSKGMRKHDMQ